MGIRSSLLAVSSLMFNQSPLPASAPKENLGGLGAEPSRERKRSELSF